MFIVFWSLILVIIPSQGGCTVGCSWAGDEYRSECVSDRILLWASCRQHLHWGHYGCKSQLRWCFMTPVLVFQAGLGKCLGEDLQIKTGKREVGGQVGPLSCQHHPLSPFYPPPPLFLPITALPFVLASVIFMASSLPPFSLCVRWGHFTQPPPDKLAHACLQRVWCLREMGQKIKKYNIFEGICLNRLEWHQRSLEQPWNAAGRCLYNKPETAVSSAFVKSQNSWPEEKTWGM